MRPEPERRDSWKAAFMAGTRTFGRRVCRSVARSASGIALDSSGPARLSGRRAKLVVATALLLAITASAAAEYIAGPGVVTAAWLAVGPLLASLVLSPRITAVVAGWTLLLGYALGEPGGRDLVTRDYIAYMTSARILIGGEIDKIV